MNEHRAFCPQCQGDVVFVKEGRSNRCPACGFTYEYSAPPRFAQEGQTRGAVSELIGLFVKVVLIMAALVVVGVAVLFAGCAIMLSGH
jgi:hypothetical protein